MANTRRTRETERIWARMARLDEEHNTVGHSFNPDCPECRVVAYDEDIAERIEEAGR